MVRCVNRIVATLAVAAIVAALPAPPLLCHYPPDHAHPPPRQSPPHTHAVCAGVSVPSWGAALLAPSAVVEVVSSAPGSAVLADGGRNLPPPRLAGSAGFDFDGGRGVNLGEIAIV